MAKDTYCVGRTDTHVHNKQMHTHTHTQHLRLLASRSVLCPSECVCDSQRHICVSMITESAFVSVVSQEHTLS